MPDEDDIKEKIRKLLKQINELLDKAEKAKGEDDWRKKVGDILSSVRYLKFDIAKALPPVLGIRFDWWFRSLDYIDGRLDLAWSESETNQSPDMLELALLEAKKEKEKALERFNGQTNDADKQKRRDILKKINEKIDEALDESKKANPNWKKITKLIDDAAKLKLDFIRLLPPVLGVPFIDWYLPLRYIDINLESLWFFGRKESWDKEWVCAVIDAIRRIKERSLEPLLE